MAVAADDAVGCAPNSDSSDVDPAASRKRRRFM
jgi:hypothetical protein